MRFNLAFKGLTLSSYLSLDLPSVLFPSGFPIWTLYEPLLSFMRATRPAHIILLDLIAWMIFGADSDWGRPAKSQLRGSLSWSRDMNWARQLRPAVSIVIKCDKRNTWSTQTTPVFGHRLELGHAPPNVKPNYQLNLKKLTKRANKLYSSCNFHTLHRLYEMPVQMNLHYGPKAETSLDERRGICGSAWMPSGP